MKTCLSYASNAAAAVGYNIKLNCNFAASVNRGVDRNWIVATIEEAPHDHDCPNETVGKKIKHQP